ncbi:uncharacterized protein LOC112566496 [Pomacea canaliculata]|uniref:uncharacterized protein LOC112566496 n=1 Tax=Pomacea canaliculata TaxID=400727 RepID=UPI000D73125E|nr:uncharacterized protein LOC112566496 [Pomacea canaliculata]
MKAVLCLLVLVASVYSVPRELIEKRFFLDDIDLDTFGLAHLFNVTTVRTTVCGIVALGGSDETEAQCEGLCHKVLTGETVAENLLHSGCPLLCNSLQKLVHLIPC